MEGLKCNDVKGIKELPSEGFQNIKPESDIDDESADSFLNELCNSLLDDPIEEYFTDIESQIFNDIISDLNDNLASYDDNGKLYKLAGELMPSKKYEINGYQYKTDSNGRIIKGEGYLQLSNEGRKTINENNIGGEDKKETDDKGHIFADRFKGSNKIENLVAMDSNLNRGDYKVLENKLANELKDGHNVKMKVSIFYEGDSKRPDKFKVVYAIDGKKSKVIFNNTSRS